MKLINYPKIHILQNTIREKENIRLKGESQISNILKNLKAIAKKEMLKQEEFAYRTNKEH